MKVVLVVAVTFLGLMLSQEALGLKIDTRASGRCVQCEADKGGRECPSQFPDTFQACQYIDVSDEFCCVTYKNPDPEPNKICYLDSECEGLCKENGWEAVCSYYPNKYPKTLKCLCVLVNPPPYGDIEAHKFA